MTELTNQHPPVEAALSPTLRRTLRLDTAAWTVPLTCPIPVTELEQGLRAVETALAPVAPGWLAKQIATLLLTYQVQGMDKEAADEVFQLWMAALAPMPQWALSPAFIETAREARFRPVPADVYQRAAEKARTLTNARARLRILLRVAAANGSDVTQNAT
ncbi:MAG: hypothetical protein NXI16_01495 [Alphaproteobacteria bacterium]|nr:hypothetical protein [Alphaproteobacteria bacterium]